MPTDASASAPRAPAMAADRTGFAFAPIVDAIAANGLAVLRHAVADPLVEGLRDAARARDAAGEFRAAGVGRAAARVERPQIRGDRIRWLDAEGARPAESALFAWLERLRLVVNEALFLGLLEFEGHYAIYPPGAGYARHVDRFRDDDARVLTLILYLNEAWAPAQGGALRIVQDDGATRDVLPEGGTLVAFLADRFPHEVLPATRERLAFAGWYRRRG
jgi:SM-20-related protein